MVRNVHVLQQNKPLLLSALQNYVRALQRGSNYVLHALPRALTLWMKHSEQSLTVTEDDTTQPSTRLGGTAASTSAAGSQSGLTFDAKLTRIGRQLLALPTYQLYTAMSQLLSAVGHTNTTTSELIKKMVVRVVQAYPRQAMWALMATVQNVTIASSTGRSAEPVRDRTYTASRDILALMVAGGGAGTALLELMNNMDALVKQMMGVAKIDDKTIDNTGTLPSAHDAPDRSRLSMRVKAPALYHFFDYTAQKARYDEQMAAHSNADGRRRSSKSVRPSNPLPEMPQSAAKHGGQALRILVPVQSQLDARLPPSTNTKLLAPNVSYVRSRF
jgi:hypothetical protein